MMLGAIVAIPSVEWSICAKDLRTGELLFEHCPHSVLHTASVGKILLLLEVARSLSAGELDATELLTRCEDDAVADSGLWQHLIGDSLHVVDAAAFIGAVSDNLATNVLLRRIGLQEVGRVARDLGLASVRLLDRVRDVRTTDDPPTLSVGSADELVRLMGLLDAGRAYSPEVSRQVLNWLALGTDLSMVAAAFGLDPLAHVGSDRDYLVTNKTGTNSEVRADVGVVHGRQTSVAYAVIANGDMMNGPVRDAVLSSTREIGILLRRAVD